MSASRTRERDHDPDGPVRERAAEAGPKAERAENERAVALPHRPVVAARRADRRAEHAGKLGQRGEQDDEPDPEAAEGGKQREGRIERRVGDDVADLVQIGAERLFWPCSRASMPSMALSAMRTKSQTGMSRNGQRAGHATATIAADRDRADGRREGHLVRGHAGAREPSDMRPQQQLERRLERIDRHGVSPKPPRSLRSGNPVRRRLCAFCLPA